jgi:hypothetical protein
MAGIRFILRGDNPIRGLFVLADYEISQNGVPELSEQCATASEAEKYATSLKEQIDHALAVAKHRLP